MAVIDGDNGDNTLNDTADYDTINGLDGNDTITVTTTSVVPPLTSISYDSVDGGLGSDTLVLTWSGATTAVVHDAGLSYTDGASRGVSIALTAGSESTIERFVITTGSGHDNFLTLEG